MGIRGTRTPTLTGLTNPMTAPGDLIAGGTAGAPLRLPAPAERRSLSYNPITQELEWIVPASVATADRAGNPLAQIERISMLNWDGFDPTGANDSLSYLQDAANQALVFGSGDFRGVVIELPVGTVVMTDKLTLGRGAYQYGSVGLIGQSRRLTLIDYQGPSDRAAIFSDGQSEAVLGNFSLLGPGRGGGAVGTSVGIAFGASSGSGTQNISNRVLPIGLDGFQTGLYIGGYDENGPAGNIAASELTFDDVRAQRCTTAILTTDQNTLNIRFKEINLSLNGTGVNFHTASSCYVDHGECSQNSVVDITVPNGGSAGIFEVRNVRSEDSNRFFINAALAQVLLENCNATLSSNADDILLELSGMNKLVNCRFIGKIAANGALLLLDHVYARGPAIVHPIGASYSNTYGEARQCYTYDAVQAETFVGLRYAFKGLTGSSLVQLEKMDALGSIWGHSPALATNATDGFFGLPSCAGIPTGTPANVPTGQIAVCVNSLTGVPYLFVGGAWTPVAGAGGGGIDSLTVDDSSIENVGTADDPSIRVKASGITNAMLAGAIALAKLASDPLARANHTGSQLASTISNFDTQVRTNRLDQMAAPSAAVPLNGQVISGLADPANAQDAATRAYVDAAVAGLSPKDAARVATTGAGTLATSFENGDTVDGVVLTTGDRILIKNQAAPAENGLYIVNASGAPTRATDADSQADLLGATVFVVEGTTNNGSLWTMTTPAPITLNTTALTWTQFGGGGTTYTAGNGLTLVGSQFALSAPVSIANGGTNASTAAAARASLGAAPLAAGYLVTTADSELSGEVVVGATPGGELGGSWASPTVDATHSGSTHAATQAAAEATAAAALAAHLADTADAHDASAISLLDTAGDFTSTDVEGALAELMQALDTLTTPLPAYTLTNVTTDRVMNANATTLDEVADLVGTLITDVAGGGIPVLNTTILSKAAAYTVTTADNRALIVADATSAAFTITLPAASGLSGFAITIKKTDASGNAVTIDGNASELIDGQLTLILSTQYESVTLVCDGSGWMVL